MSFLKTISAKYQIRADEHEFEEEHLADEQEDEEDKPEDDDIYLTPTGSLGSQISLSAGGKHLGDFAEDGDAQKAIVDWMNKNKFYPNIWFISDHGNTHPYQLDDNYAKMVK